MSKAHDKPGSLCAYAAESTDNEGKLLQLNQQHRYSFNKPPLVQDCEPLPTLAAPKPTNPLTLLKCMDRERHVIPCPEEDRLAVPTIQIHGRPLECDFKVPNIRRFIPGPVFTSQVPGSSSHTSTCRRVFGRGLWAHQSLLPEVTG